MPFNATFQAMWIQIFFQMMILCQKIVSCSQQKILLADSRNNKKRPHSPSAPDASSVATNALNIREEPESSCSQPLSNAETSAPDASSVATNTLNIREEPESSWQWNVNVKL